jgi:hypothetical protein
MKKFLFIINVLYSPHLLGSFVETLDRDIAGRRSIEIPVIL